MPGGDEGVAGGMASAARPRNGAVASKGISRCPWQAGGNGCPPAKAKQEAQQRLDTALASLAGQQSAKSQAKRRPAKAANREGEVCTPRRRERAMHAREVLRARAWVDEGDTGTMPGPAGSKPCSSFSVAWYIASYIT